MLLDSFEVENFRSLKHLKLEKLARVNLLVGKNNVGKTTVLESIYALIGTGTSNWLTVFLRERGLSYSDFDFKHLFYRLNPENTIDTKVRFGDFVERDNPVDYRFAEVQMSYMNGTVAQDDLDWDSNGAVERSMQEGGLLLEIQTELMLEPAKFELVYIPNRALSRFRLRESTENSVNVSDLRNTPSFKLFGRPNISFVSSHSALRSYSSDIEKIKIAKKDEELVDVLRQVDDRIERIELGSNGNVFLNLGSHLNSLLPASLSGEGIQRLLSIVAVLANRGNGIVLIDEVDNGLHYSALRVLWKGVLYAARKYNVQVFVTTHNAEAMRHLTWVLDDEDYKEYRKDVAAYTLIRATDDTVRSFRYNYEQLEFAMEQDIEVRN